MLKFDLYVYFSQKLAHRRDFDETKYMSFLIKDDELLEKNKKFERMLKIVSRKNLIVSQYTIKNI